MNELNNFRARLIIENCLGKGNNQEQADKIIKSLRTEKFYIISEADKTNKDISKDAKKMAELSEKISNMAKHLKEFEIEDFACE